MWGGPLGKDGGFHVEYCWEILQSRDWPTFFSARGTCLNFLGWKSFPVGPWSCRSHLGARISHYSFVSFQHTGLAMSPHGSVSEAWPGWPSSSPWRCTFPHRPGAQSQMAESTCKEPRKTVRQLARVVRLEPCLPVWLTLKTQSERLVLASWPYGSFTERSD